VTWYGATQRLGLVVHEGRVHVSGPADQSHDVAAGQRIEISPHQLIAAADPTAPAVGDTREVADTSVRPGSPSDRAGPERTKPRKNATEKSVVLTDWSALARASKHKEALAAAEAVGFTTLCDSLDAASLLQLADTARFAGRAARSITALEALRRRHPRSDEAVVAAYTLGRIAAAADRHADAAEHFATYLRERPRGSLAREALGRKLEAEAAAGQGARADATAKSYLDRYPAGPHADLAAARLK
jgi:TolA-binding protein